MSIQLNFSNSNLTTLSSYVFPLQNTKIILDNNQLTDISALNDSGSNLETISLQNNQTLQISDFSIFNSFIKLENLYVSNCNVSSLININNTLKYLDISNNLISDLSPLLNCSNLIDLNASNNQIITITDVLPTTLINLNISNNQLTSLTGLPNGIMYLNVSYNNGISLLTGIPSSIRSLNISGTSITDFSDLPSHCNEVIHEETSLTSINTLPTVNNEIMIQTQKASNFSNEQNISKTLNMNFKQGGTTITNNKNNTFVTANSIYYPGSLLFPISILVISILTSDSTNGTVFRLQDVTNNKTLLTSTIYNTKMQSLKYSLFNIPLNASTVELQIKRGLTSELLGYAIVYFAILY